MNQYVQLKTLARGSLGMVLLLREKRNSAANRLATGDSESSGSSNSPLRVAKQMDLRRIPTASHGDLQAEVSQLCQLSNPNIVTYFGACVEQMVLHIITEFVDGEDLGMTVARMKDEGCIFSEVDALCVAAHTASALKHAHGLGITHKDLRCENIFLSRAGGVKVGDFCPATVFQLLAREGFSAPQHGAGQSSSARHLAPEVLEGSEYTYASDVWSLGVVLYTLLALRPPFQSFNPEGLIFKIVSTEPPPLPDGYSEEVYEIPRQTLVKNPAARPSMEALVQMPGTCRGARAPAPLPQTEPMHLVGERQQAPEESGAELPTPQQVEIAQAPSSSVSAPPGVGSTAAGDAVDELLSIAKAPAKSSSAVSLRDAPPLRGMQRVESCPSSVKNSKGTPTGMGRSRLGLAGGNVAGERPGTSPKTQNDPRVAAAMAMDYLSPLDWSPSAPAQPLSPVSRGASAALARHAAIEQRTLESGPPSTPTKGSRGKATDNTCRSPFDQHIDDVMDELLLRERKLMEM